jgi:hypothetical protein
VIARLTDPWFEAEFIGGITSSGFHRLPSIEGAQAVFLYGPCGYGQNDGTHGLIVPFANPRNGPAVPSDFVPKDRWQMSGSSLEDLTLSPSVNCAIGPPHPEFNLAAGECKPGRPCWHGWIQNGEVR